ncbi:unnamed protein product [Psylliodes chrysocephalus]|uniref:Uncharacterized protein n=1 Tax=Psylliodes chrysocephalus TaxID=3402493 RepID=A0A9P0CYD0_9CUCU|nr:unnamed protein product [Psylliodes chrysocephala]
MYSQDNGYGSEDSEFDVPITPSPPEPLSPSIVSEDYDHEIDSLLERYEEASKNEEYYLLYTQFPHDIGQIGCGLSPARSFTPAVVMHKDQWEKVSFSSYEWEQLITHLRDSNFFNEIVDRPDDVEIKCGDYCKLQHVIYDSTKFIKVTKHNLSFFLSQADVMNLLHINNELLVSYISMLEKVEFPNYYYNLLKSVRASFTNDTYEFSDAFHKMHVFKNLDCNLKNIALGQFMYYYKYKIVNDFDRI